MQMPRRFACAAPPRRLQMCVSFALCVGTPPAAGARAHCAAQHTALCATMEDALEVRTMHVFISRALEKLLKEAPKKQTQLREACKTVIGTRRAADCTAVPL